MKHWKILLSAVALASAMLMSTMSTEVIAALSNFKSITVKSGMSHKAGTHWASQVNNAPVPYSIKVSEPPKQGTVTLRQEAGRTSVVYQSRSGYTGTDGFKYVRVSDDRFAGTYTVAVTVR